MTSCKQVSNWRSEETSTLGVFIWIRLGPSPEWSQGLTQNSALTRTWTCRSWMGRFCTAGSKARECFTRPTSRKTEASGIKISTWKQTPSRPSKRRADGFTFRRWTSSRFLVFYWTGSSTWYVRCPVPSEFRKYISVLEVDESDSGNLWFVELWWLEVPDATRKNAAKLGKHFDIRARRANRGRCRRRGGVRDRPFRSEHEGWIQVQRTVGPAILRSPS